MLSNANYELLKTFENGEPQDYTESNERMKSLVDQGYLSISHTLESTGNKLIPCIPHYYATITEKGKDALLEYEEDQRRRKQEAKDKKTNRRFQLLNTLLSALAGSLLTILIEHIDTIVEVLRSFFQ